MPRAVLRHHVGLADLVPPAVPAHQDYEEHGQDEGPVLPLGPLHIQSDVTVESPVITVTLNLACWPA